MQIDKMLQIIHEYIYPPGGLMDISFQHIPPGA